MSNTPRLFLVVLGGRTATSHIELHDVRWVAGSDIEATIPALKQNQVGNESGGLLLTEGKAQHVSPGFEMSAQVRKVSRNCAHADLSAVAFEGAFFRR